MFWQSEERCPGCLDEDCPDCLGLTDTLPKPTFWERAGFFLLETVAFIFIGLPIGIPLLLFRWFIAWMKGRQN
jgi:hypothetical protein